MAVFLPPLPFLSPLINWRGKSHFGTHITASITVNPLGALKGRKLKKETGENISANTT
jgi:hypothetical protein